MADHALFSKLDKGLESTLLLKLFSGWISVELHHIDIVSSQPSKALGYSGADIEWCEDMWSVLLLAITHRTSTLGSQDYLVPLSAKCRANSLFTSSVVDRGIEVMNAEIECGMQDLDGFGISQLD